MSAELSAKLLDMNAPAWPVEVDRLRALLGAPNNPLLFPPHFLKVTLARIGGQAVVYGRAGEEVGAGFLFPTALPAGRRLFTLRFHAIGPAPAFDPEELARLAAAAIADADVRFYNPLAPHRFEPSYLDQAGLELGRPSAVEAEAMRTMQEAIWGSAPDYLYPADIHSSDFGSVPSSVARVDGRLSGYLFGFTRFGGASLPETWQGQVRSDLRLESQQLAVLPGFRGRGIASALKAAQAGHARQAGIDLVNWTADPLQWPNAVLNYGRLRALAFDFFPHHYPFRNALNQIGTSRIGLTWLVGSRRVQAGLVRPSGALPALPKTLGTVRVNDGPNLLKLDADAPAIAIEVPANWTALQGEAPDAAIRWRDASDRLLSAYLGVTVGRYVITDVAEDGARKFVLAQQLTRALAAALTQ